MSLDFLDQLACDWPSRRRFRAEKKVGKKIIAGPNDLHTQLGTITNPFYNGFPSSCQHLPPFPASGLGW